MLQLSVEKLSREGAFLMDAGMVRFTEYKRWYVVCASVEQSRSLGLPLGEMLFYPINFK